MRTRQILAVIIGTMVAGATAFAEGAPKLQFEKMIYDFGTTSQVDRLQGTFVFSNAGDAVLQVQKPQPSCGCTVAGVKPETVPPGAKGELTFTVNVPQATGHIEKWITVPSNDTNSPSQRLTIKADIRKTYDVKPPQMLVGMLREGQTTNVAFTVRRLDGQKLVLTKVVADSPMLSGKIEMAAGTDDPSAQIVVEVKATGAPRSFTEGLHVYADDTNTPAIHLSVSGRVLGELTVTPEMLLWGITDTDNWPGSRPAAVTTRRVNVSMTETGRILEVSNPSCNLSDLTVEVQTVETGKMYAVVAKLVKAPGESQQGVIKFKTNLPKYPEVQVPIVIHVLPSRRVPFRALPASATPANPQVAPAPAAPVAPAPANP